VTITEWQREAHRIAVEHGWWEDGDRPIGDVLMLIVTEVAEAMEAHRRGNPGSRSIPGFSAIEEELADVLIRTFDFAERMGFDLDGAVRAKMDHNESRPYRHGGKRA